MAASIVKNSEIGRMYPGGKAQPGIYQRIINQMPPHRYYVELCLGMGAVMRHKRPAEHSLGVEIDPETLAQWRGDEVPNLYLLEQCALDYLADSQIDDLDEHALIYLDPPYLMETRLQHRPIYRYEMTEADHVRLLALIRELPCMVMISGYWSELYASELAGWRTISFQAVTHGGSLATEWLWMNYPEPAELHDYQYLGESFRERERIKRKISRWVSRLERMPILERRALSAALAKVGDASRLDPPSSDLEMGPGQASPITQMLEHDRRHRRI
jgi:DNA adenine methylase